MTARDTFYASVKTAEATKLSTLQAAATAAQEQINVTGVNAGANPQRGGASDAVIAATKAANIAYQVSQYNAHAAAQAAIAVARDTLRATGDLNPI